MSPELEAAIEAADREPLGPARDRRGFLFIGPRFVTPSDVLVKAMEAAKLALTIYATDTRFKPDIVEERRAQRIQAGRAAQRKRQYAKRGRAEFAKAAGLSAA